MILPIDIKSRNKLRDSKILSIYASGNSDQSFIAQKFNLSQPRINQILKSNARLLLNNADWEKLQRIAIIKSDLERKEFKSQVLSKKDAIELWRKEFEQDFKNPVSNQVLVNISLEQKNNDNTSNSPMESITLNSVDLKSSTCQSQ